MRNIMMACAAALSFSALAGCSTFGISDRPILEQTVIDEQALYVAETAFQGVSLALESAVDNGLLRGENAATAQGYYRGAYEALQAAREAQEVGDSGTLLQQSILVQQYAAQVFNLIR